MLAVALTLSQPLRKPGLVSQRPTSRCALPAPCGRALMHRELGAAGKQGEVVLPNAVGQSTGLCAAPGGTGGRGAAWWILMLLVPAGAGEQQRLLWQGSGCCAEHRVCSV